MKAITILICMVFSSFATYHISQNYFWKTIEERVFAQYGEGDAGVEQMLYLQTGVYQDFMGNPKEEGQ